MAHELKATIRLTAICDNVAAIAAANANIEAAEQMLREKFGVAFSIVVEPPKLVSIREKKADPMDIPATLKR